MIEINSKDNQTVKDTAKLKLSSKARKEQRKFFIEGARLCEDAVISNVAIKSLFYTNEAKEKFSDIIKKIAEKAENIYLVSDEVATKMSDTVHTQGIFCVCDMPETDLFFENPGSGRFVALEDIQDPSNMGTILRTAEALGFNGVIVSAGCCDVYNSKVIRGSMGAIFRLPVYVAENFPEQIRKLRSGGLRPLAAVPDSDASKITAIRFFKGVVMCIGNEGNGLTEETIAACGERVTIPMTGTAESLNAAIAASILMWEMVRSN